MFLKIIACEIAFREVCHLAATSPHLIDCEFLTQGHHDRPAEGRREIQQRIDALPEGKYDAVLIGYGVCSSILPGLRAASCPLIVPRAHDCITLFLGSKERYQECFSARPGTYYFTSGWLECRQRRGSDLPPDHGAFLPAHSIGGFAQQFEEWVAKYGEEKARYLASVMGEWTRHYTHGTLIEFDFARPLRLGERVQAICRQEGWQFEELPGDLELLRRWLAGEWDPETFLRVEPGQTLVLTLDERIIGVEPAPAYPAGHSAGSPPAARPVGTVQGE